MDIILSDIPWFASQGWLGLRNYVAWTSVGWYLLTSCLQMDITICFDYERRCIFGRLSRLFGRCDSSSSSLDSPDSLRTTRNSQWLSRPKNIVRFSCKNVPFFECCCVTSCFRRCKFERCCVCMATKNRLHLLSTWKKRQARQFIFQTSTINCSSCNVYILSPNAMIRNMKVTAICLQRNLDTCHHDAFGNVNWPTRWMRI